MIFAAQQGHYDVVDMLLKAGADFNDQDEYVNTVKIYITFSIHAFCWTMHVFCLP